MQLGKLDSVGQAKATLLSKIVDQAFFYELRTKQQLGYIVQAGLSVDRDISYLVFLVQSAVSPDEVSKRVTTFVDSIGKRIEDTPQETFDGLKSTSHATLLEPAKKLSDVADDAWFEILDETNNFERSGKVAKELEKLEMKDVLSLWQEKSKMTNGGGRLLIQVYGAKHQMKTTPSEMSLASASPSSGLPKGYEKIDSMDTFRKDSSFW